MEGISGRSSGGRAQAARFCGQLVEDALESAQLGFAEGTS